MHIKTNLSDNGDGSKQNYDYIDERARKGLSHLFLVSFLACMNRSAGLEKVPLLLLL